MPDFNFSAGLYNAVEQLRHQIERQNEFLERNEQRTQRAEIQRESDATVRERTVASAANAPYVGADLTSARDTRLIQEFARTITETAQRQQPGAPQQENQGLMDLVRAYRSELSYQKQMGVPGGRRTALRNVTQRLQDQQAQPDNLPPQGPAPPPVAAGAVGPSASIAVPGGGGAVRGGPHSLDMAPTDAMSWAILGEHGGPAFIRNRALEYYGLERSMQWMQQGAQQLQGANIPRWLQRVGVTPESTGMVSDLLTNAMNHPLASYAGYKAVQGATGIIRGINDHLSNAQTIGQQFGYGAPPGGQAFMGFRNPLGDVGTAAQVGMGFDIERQRLMGRIPGSGFGGGLTSTTATEVMDVLGNQGFGMAPGMAGARGQGDAATIASGFMAPMLQQFPGLTAQDLGQFTPMLRNSATSVQQLNAALSGLGQESRAAKVTVGQMATSLAELAQQAQGMGASSHGGLALGTGFTNTTGLAPQFAGEFLQSPMVQGLALTRGILPSGLGDMNSGEFSAITQQAVQLLQRNTAGLNRPVYTTINGHRVLTEPGYVRQTDQIAQILGVPSDVVRRMLGEHHMAGRTTVQTALGDPTQGTGLWQFLNAHGGHLTAAQNAAANNIWQGTITPSLGRAGLSHAEVQQLSRTRDVRARAQLLKNDLANSANRESYNQVQKNANAQTVYVKFTGAAAKIFQVAGVSPAKLDALAGGPAYNHVTNTLLGDNTKYAPAPTLTGNPYVNGPSYGGS